MAYSCWAPGAYGGETEAKSDLMCAMLEDQRTASNTVNIEY